MDLVIEYRYEDGNNGSHTVGTYEDLDITIRDAFAQDGRMNSLDAAGIVSITIQRETKEQ